MFQVSDVDVVWACGVVVFGLLYCFFCVLFRDNFLWFLGFPVYNSIVQCALFGCVELLVEALCFIRFCSGGEFIEFNGIIARLFVCLSCCLLLWLYSKVVCLAAVVSVVC